ncbi:hypothetical protein ABKV19_021353 [Rosa sericea]
MGVKFPSWLLLSNNLKEIELEVCNKCEGVPVLGHLPNLVHVKMKWMQNMRCLGYEFYGYDRVSDEIKILFPALKTLCIECAENLIEWMEVATERVTVFPCLEELTLKYCSQLRSAPSHFPSLKKLVIEDMNSGGIPIASILSNKLTTLTSLEIGRVGGLACLPERLLENNQNLAHLEIWNCEELTCIAPPQSQGFEYRCASLQELRISKCPKLRCLPDYGLLSSLEKLKISYCSSLESIPEHGGLRELEIEECPELSSLPDGLQYCASLQRLDIRRCPKITSIPFPSLCELSLSRCPELSSLPSGLGCCTSLVDLEVTQCPKVTSIPIVHGGFSSLRNLTVSNPESLPILHGLRLLEIEECQSTQIDLQFCDFLQILVSLEVLIIRNCPNLETVPSLDKLTSLRALVITDCSRLTCLPGGLVFTRLNKLRLGPFWEELDSFPAFQVLPQLEALTIYGWPKLKSLPEQIQHLTSLTLLFINSFEGVEAIPEWLGNLASLQFLSIMSCKNLMHLPSVQAMHRLTKLDGIQIVNCPILSERCREESGPEWPKISHFPHTNELPAGISQFGIAPSFAIICEHLQFNIISLPALQDWGPKGKLEKGGLMLLCGFVKSIRSHSNCYSYRFLSVKFRRKIHSTPYLS